MKVALYKEIRGRFCGLRRKFDFSKNPKVVKNYLTGFIDSGIISLALGRELNGAWVRKHLRDLGF